MRPAPPSGVPELLERAASLSGRTVGELGSQAGVPVPEQQTRAKGLVGTLVEWHLGADGHSRAEPDFTALGVELKTIPLDPRGRPQESTFVCSIALADLADISWEQSRVRHKLARVLWVPIEADRRLPLPGRRVGRARLWSPSPAEEQLLRKDWEGIAELLARGDVHQITAHLGSALQVRPKAAHGRVRRRARDAEGAPIAAQPRGFYLRQSFTAKLFVISRA